jgi:ABC-2 type transport system permease protein
MKTTTSFRSPDHVVRRFVTKTTSRSAFLWGFIFGIYIISKATSYIQTYSTEAARQKIAETLGTNIGIEAILGVAHHIDTVAGYAAWNFLCFLSAVGAVWALLIATKTFRGQEDTGRWELFLAGQTTARKAAADALSGLASGLVILYVFIAAAIFAIGKLRGVDFTTSASLFFALSLIAGAAEFIAVGALASQLMPVRARAAGLSAAVFGVFYMIRLTADTTNAHWLLNFSPLGWIEKLQPLYATDAVWLLPIGGFVLLLSGLAIFLAGKRDLDEGIFADKDNAQSHTLLLGTPLGAAIRLNRVVTLGWLAAIGIAAFIYGLLAKGAVVQALDQSKTAKKVLNRLTQASGPNEVSLFLGITFFLVMVLAMFYAASAIGRMREDEADGYLDNFLVRPVSRVRWLSGRVLLIVSVVILAGLLSSLATWAGEASQHGGVSIHTLLLAGANAVAPVILLVGIGVCAMGSIPRLTGALTYGAIAWSFLIVMLSSGLNLNHWLLDTSILHQVALAPAADPNWVTNTVLVGIGAMLCAAGTIFFNRRDLQAE